MPNLPDVDITELQNALGIVPPGNDEIPAFIGCSSKGPTNTPAAYGTVAALVADFGEGPMVDDAALVLNGSESADSKGTFVVVCRTPSSTPGSMGVIDISGVVGTAVPTASGTPLNWYDGYLEVVRGGTLGTDGITLKWSLDSGRNTSVEMALGTAYSFAIPGSGFAFDFGPPSAQVTAFVAAAVEARADTLAHLADVTAHDAADTSAAQIALAASGVPSTAAEAWVVLNLCRTALASHETNITAHNGPDPVNVVSHAAATDAQTGIDLFIEYKAEFNAHLGIALAAAPAGLKAATATVAAQVVLTAADLLSAGLALLLTYPRRLTFTTAGATPADAPASVDIAGTDSAGAAQTETLNLAQTATVVTSAKAYKTITSLTYPTADGTAATVAIGYGQGVHNSADVTNTTTAAAPTHGTLVAGDVILQPTIEPKWISSDITDASTALQNGQQGFGFIVICGPVDSTEEATIGTALDALRTAKKFRWGIWGARGPNAGESESTWSSALETNYASVARPDIAVCAGTWWQNSATGARQCTRRITGAVAARIASIPIYIDAAKVALGPLRSGRLFDNNSNAIGHDERVYPGLTTSNRFITLRSFTPRGNFAYISDPLLMSTPGSDFVRVQHRRVMNVLERVIYETGLNIDLSAEGTVDEPADENNPSTAYVSEISARDIEGDMRAAITAALRPAISNPDDPAIFVLSRTDPVLTNGGKLTGSSRIAPLFYIKNLSITTGFKA